MIRIKDYTNTADARPLMEFVAGELGISGVEVIITGNDGVLNRFGTKDLRLNALLYKSELPGVYNLAVRERRDGSACLTLCHEMVHLKQYVDGRLTVDMNSKAFGWEGARYSCDTPYEARPWEAEAFRMQWPLLRSYKRHLRETKKNKA